MTITRTFSAEVNSTYVPLAIIEVVHFRDMTFDADERVACYIDNSNTIIDISSFNLGKIPDLEGDETDIEQALALNKAENESNKIGLKILQRKNNTGNWFPVATFTLMNVGRVEYLDMRGRLGYPTKLMEKNDALAIQLIDYGDGLLWDTDFIKVDFAASIEIVKKNNTEALEARLAALELALEGRLINIPANSILGKNAGVGTVEILPQSKFLIADASNTVTPPSPSSTYGSLSLGGSKTGYAGVNFASASNTPTFMFSTATRHHGVLSPGAIGGWHWLYDNGNFHIYSSAATSQGTYIGLFKGLGSLPGFAADRYPTLKTDDANLYFSVGGAFSAYINTNGVFMQGSDKNTKENLTQTDNTKILNLLLSMPTYTYNFKNCDKRIKNLGCMAQDFYERFGLGGDVEIENDDTPIAPSKMVSTLDLVGVCMAAIKGLNAKIDKLVSK